MKNRFNLKFKSLIFSLLLITFSLNTTPSFAGGEEGAEFNAGELLLHHVGDDYSWHFATVGESHYSIPLPMILIVDGNVEIFMSSVFHHSEMLKDDYYETPSGAFKLDHGVLTEKSGKKFYDFSFTKNALSMLLSAIILIVIFISVANRYKRSPNEAPKGLQALIEPLFEFVKVEICENFIGKKKAGKYLPYVATVFFFIWVNNLLGLLPSGANASGNISFTFTLAFFTLIVTNFSGNKHYWTHIFWTPGVPLLMRAIMINENCFSTY